VLTIARLEELAAVYGADLHRWPEESRHEAQALLNTSAEARAILAEARLLDMALGAATKFDDATLWKSRDQPVALERLRAGVSARIGESTSRPRPALFGPRAPRRARKRTQEQRLRERGMGSMGLFGFGRLGVAGIGVAAVVAGLFIGAGYTPPATPDDLLSAMQLTPIYVLAH
jgi:hypothetical protein